MGAREATQLLRRESAHLEGPSLILNRHVRQLPTVFTPSSKASIASDLRGQLHSHAHTHTPAHTYTALQII